MFLKFMSWLKSIFSKNKEKQTEAKIESDWMLWINDNHQGVIARNPYAVNIVENKYVPNMQCSRSDSEISALDVIEAVVIAEAIESIIESPSCSDSYSSSSNDDYSGGGGNFGGGGSDGDW